MQYSTFLLALVAPISVFGNDLKDLKIGTGGTGVCRTQKPISLFGNWTCDKSGPSKADLSDAFEDAIGSDQTVLGPAKKQSSPWAFEPKCFKPHFVEKNSTAEDFCVYTSTSFARGRGISFVTTPSGAERIAKNPAFVNPKVLDDVNVERVPPYQPIMIPGRGIGLYMNRTVYRGDRLFSHTPAIVVHQNTSSMLNKDRLELQRLGIDQLPAKTRDMFLALHGHFGGDDVNDRINTNAFDIQVDETGESHFGILPETSRMNHACRPNAHYYFESQTMTHHVHALRTINPGEELTISYLDPAMTREERMDKLEYTWGFKCDCSQCTKPDIISAASDSRLRMIEHMEDELADRGPESTANPEMAELYVSLHEQEGLLAPIADAYTYAALEYNGQGNPNMAKKYAALSVEAGLLYGGPESEDVPAMQSLLNNPQKHWSWRFRHRNHEVDFTPAS